MKKKTTNGIQDHHKVKRPTVYHRGSQRDGSPSYVLLYSDEEYSDEEKDIPLQNRNSSKQLPRKVEVINIQVQADDTLQAIALKYMCTISELKRINNIDKDNEIFAHRSIKVPVKPFSVLTETLEANAEATKNTKQVDKNQPSISRDDQIINLITTPVLPFTPSTEINDIIMNSKCEPSMSNSQSTDNSMDSETDHLVSFPERLNSTNTSLSDSFKCSGADWGLSWFQLLGFSLILGFAGPIIYILFITDSAHKHHHYDSTTRQPTFQKILPQTLN